MYSTVTPHIIKLPQRSIQYSVYIYTRVSGHCEPAIHIPTDFSWTIILLAWVLVDPVLTTEKPDMIDALSHRLSAKTAWNKTGEAAYNNQATVLIGANPKFI